ncbi:hypothetical protein OG426_55375 (plasmid) [Streptomyces canus]|uniref:hypothetical protein n=1 Tax=Streptomyces canus TaxID=58343 RepID=UPI002F91A5A7|nr:hypothetical protein OG426_55375 [Streptomyces canus]
MVSLQELPEAVFVLDEPDASVVEKIEAFLRRAVGSSLEGGRTPDGTLSIGEIKDAGELVDEWDADQIHDVSLVRLKAFAGFNEVSIDRLTGVASAQVFLCPEVEYSGWALDADGATRTHSGRIPDVIVRDVLNFTIEDGAVVRAESASGEAVAFGRRNRGFGEADEAFSELLDALTLVPAVGLNPELSAGLADLEIGGDLTLTLGGHFLTITCDGSGDGWVATLVVTKDGSGSAASLEVTCQWDPSKNPYGMPDLFPAWVVYTESEVSDRAPAEWAAPVWVIEQLMPNEEPSAPSSP